MQLMHLSTSKHVSWKVTSYLSFYFSSLLSVCVCVEKITPESPILWFFAKRWFSFVFMSSEVYGVGYESICFL